MLAAMLPEMYWSKRYNLLLLFFVLAGLSLKGGYFCAGKQGEKNLLPPYSVSLHFPGENRFFERADRKTFHPDIARFNAGELSVAVRAVSGKLPVKCRFYLKNKEGVWFQSVREFQISGKEWQTLTIRTDRRGRDWSGMGHGGIYSAADLLYSSEIGLSFYRDDAGETVLECRPFQFGAKRETPPLAVTGLCYPVSGPVNRVVEARFDLSREYFNPFDPDEIKVDFELEHPGGKVTRHPGFWGREQRRESYHAQERLLPDGRGFWAIRFLPYTAGKYRFRVIVSERNKEVLSGGWQEFNAVSSALPGFVQVSRKRSNFFELSTGEFFFPVGLNIHTNIDIRSENLYGFGELADRGLTDTLEYFDKCGDAGINLIELWMAGWGLALEHSAEYPGYYGSLRFNMGNAWKLDRILEKAREKNIRINLVIDNHGRASRHSDAEWDKNPVNAKSAYAKANGGFLPEPEAFFRKEEAMKHNRKRMRYIAARWGSDPHIFAVELWSELDLVHNYNNLLKDGSMVRWIIRTRKEYWEMAQLKHLLTVHYCGTFHNILGREQVFSKTGVTHYAGDAYRDTRQAISDHLADYRNRMKRNVPLMLTEYGGHSSIASRREQILADIHFGLWGGMFARLAGTPMLWWHDVIHRNNYYFHYAGFNKFFKGIDLRGKQLDYYSPQVNTKLCKAMGVTADSGIYGWGYRQEFARAYPLKEPLPIHGVDFVLPDVPAGKWKYRWFDTLQGEIYSGIIEQKKRGPLVLQAPPFAVDIAYRLERVK